MYSAKDALRGYFSASFLHISSVIFSGFGFFLGYCFFWLFNGKGIAEVTVANLDWVPPFVILFCLRSYERNRARLSRVASCKNVTVNTRQVAQRVFCGTYTLHL